MSKLSGYTMIRNALELDYPVHLAIDSLLAGCDEVVVGVAESTDGTLEWLRDRYAGEPRVVLVPQPWPNPRGDVQWWVKWINRTRQHLTGDVQLMLDADEVIEPEVFGVLRAAAPSAVYTLHRLNYWRDARHTIKPGWCCSHKVVRFAPAHLHMTSDEIYDGNGFPKEEPEIRRRATDRMDLKIHHVGFLRKREALFKKVEVCLRAFFGSEQDQRLVRAMAHPEVHWSTFVEQPLERYEGGHPAVAVPWLKERGAL